MRRDPLEQATREQCGRGLLAVLGGDQQSAHRTVGLRHEDAKCNAVSRPAVLLRAPAVEEVPGHGPTVASHLLHQRVLRNHLVRNQ